MQYVWKASKEAKRHKAVGCWRDGGMADWVNGKENPFVHYMQGEQH
ncbi:hypothetical protein GI364_11005 [Alicyclobacillus sp. SO9]|nr:hypothetical protein GI364_11005 [Alicyclobacillus sp. SO9]